MRFEMTGGWFILAAIAVAYRCGVDKGKKAKIYH